MKPLIEEAPGDAEADATVLQGIMRSLDVVVAHKPLRQIDALDEDVGAFHLEYLFVRISASPPAFYQQKATNL